MMNSSNFNTFRKIVVFFTLTKIWNVHAEVQKESSKHNKCKFFLCESRVSSSYSAWDVD